MGVLNDFDLTAPASGETGYGSFSTDRLGTLPFMAWELFGRRALEGHVKHCYGHDFESFFWVLTWVAHRIQNGTPIPHPQKLS
ncbi:hypothetical protein FRC02_007750 [Tulasnella sp. 418]|nr:hypothetical protein FRC02_007750 [Tulasnella sp. 418]